MFVYYVYNIDDSDEDPVFCTTLEIAETWLKFKTAHASDSATEKKNTESVKSPLYLLMHPARR